MTQEERTLLFRNLNAVDQDGDQKIPSTEIVKGVLHIAQAQACEHGAYQHYTSLKAFTHIFNPKHPGLRLSRIDSDRLNDQNEMRKYGVGMPNAFVACFSHAASESASLWWLYAQGQRQAMRITFPKEVFKQWRRFVSCPSSRKLWETLGGDGAKTLLPIRWACPLVTDVVYLAVKGACDVYSQSRKNVLSWEDQCVEAEGLWKSVYRKGHLGVFKDYEWKDERETRIVVNMRTFNEQVKYVCLPFDKATISQLKITTSPWATKADEEMIKAKAVELLSPFGWRPTKQNFHTSVLSGALQPLSK